MSLTQTIDALMTLAIEQRVFPGAVVQVLVDGQVLHRAAYGTTMYADPGTRRVTPETLYDIASLTKMFTATAALRLIDQGRMALHLPASLYLPELQATDVTVWHLLTHTSGLDIRLSVLREQGRAGLLAAAYAAKQVAPAGTRVAYTNVNSLLLGEIVSRLCQQPLDQAIAALVTEPLDLHETLFCPPVEWYSRCAPTELDVGWRGRLVHGTVHDESAHVLDGVAGHAGMFSTAADLARFCQAWLDTLLPNQPNGLLSVTLAQLATTNQTVALGLGCGLGWMMDRPNVMGQAPAGSFGHTGFTGPAIVMIPQWRVAIVLLSNRIYPSRGDATHHPVTAALCNAVLAEVGALAADPLS